MGELGQNITSDQPSLAPSLSHFLADITDATSLEEKEKITHELLEKIKELNCLYQISSEIEACSTLEDLLPHIAHHLTYGLQFPHHARVSLTLDGQNFGGGLSSLQETHSISSEIKVRAHLRGSITISYPHHRHFIDDDVRLVHTIAEKVGKAVEKVELEQVVKSQNDRLDLLFTSMNEAVALIEQDYRISFMNRAAKETFGDHTGNLCYQAFMEHHEPCQKCALEEIINNKSHRFKRTTQCKGGRWVELTASPVRSIDGTLSVLEILRDISENKRLENELKHSEEQYRTLLEKANDAIVSIQPGGSITFFNNKAEEVFGYTQNEVIGKSLLNLLPERVRTIQKEYMHKFLDPQPFEERGLILEGVGLRKNGTEFPVEFTSIPLEIGNYGFIIIMRDVSPVREAEEEKAKIDARLQDKVIELSIMNEISEVLLSTRELNEILHMILIGATASQALGFNRAFLFLITEDETMLEGKVATGSLNPDEAYRIWARLADEHHTLKELLKSRQGELSQEDIPINNLVKQMKLPLQEKESIFTQAIHEKKSFNIINGTHHPLIEKDFIRLLGTDTFALVPLTARGKSLGLLLADNFINRKPISDEDVARLEAFANHASLAIENSHLYQSLEEKIEELSSAYHELRENRDKLLRYERLSAVGNVAARITHEIRNPLVAIGGFARRILKRDQEGEVNRNYVRIIVEEIGRLENTLASILAFTKPAEPQCSATDVNTIVKTTLEVMGIELEKNNISVEEYYDVHLPLLWLDENQIRQVMINLFRNAIQAMPDGGTVTVATIAEHLWVKVEIADTGVGITDEDMDRLFDAFFTSKSTGSGLGLTVSAQIINHHGGAIEVRKREPRGTTFTVKLPVTPPPEKAIT